ncbi:MAG: hypothetical protein CMJ98_09670, partial [Planctomycetes bacterium]|nr:hypothetical protein [Planctomycetota bacterium]
MCEDGAMKVTLCCLLSFAASAPTVGQDFGPANILASGGGADSAQSVYATDLDGDGDADVLSASYYDDKIAWYENQGGGLFG